MPLLRGHRTRGVRVGGVPVTGQGYKGRGSVLGTRGAGKRAERGAGEGREPAMPSGSRSIVKVLSLGKWSEQREEE